MNNQRRKDIQTAMSLLEEANAKLDAAKSILETAGEEEREAYDNLPESIQEGERGCAMEEAADNLDDAVSTIEDIIGYVQEVIDNAEEIINA